MTDKKELIRKAAINVMSKKGFYNTKTSEIAEEANVAVGTIYNYFKNKEDILNYIFKYELEKRMKNLKKIKQQNLNFWEKLEKFLNFHFKEIKENIAVGEILVREKDFPKKEGSDSINEYLTMIPEILENELKDAIQRGEINESYDPEISANIIFGSIQGIVEKAIKNEDKNMLMKAPEELIMILKKGLRE
ncbi:MAG TPA: TetR/AcrR family transcriptional regulator [Halanaerobiales bacterium]|mgnify:CR=1 FL=1|nr:TetR/AcrR family transcriptional regulator [Halanaerobiales bacterium]